MCGIAGVLIPAAVGEAEALCRRLIAAQAHRGPDDEGVAVFSARDQGTVALGSRRLAILDLSDAGHQPMGNEDGTVWAVHNGELYNFEALRAQLIARGHRFRSRTDTEVIVHAYEVFGPDCVRQFQGMFAFAVWDATRQQLLLARDRFGEKPLYLRRVGEAVAFASEVRALLAAGVAAPEPDPAAVQAYLALGSVPAPRTILRGVQSLEPGCYAVIKPGTFAVTRYWEVSYPPERPVRRAEALEDLRARLIEAVRACLISDVPLGAFLSGGTDSSAVVALMRQAGVVDLRTFSLTFEEALYDEGPFAEAVSRHLDTRHMSCRVTAAGVREALPQIIQAMDQPSVDGLNTYLVSRLTRASGTIVALSGLGGDELFGGYTSFRRVPRLRRAGRALGPLCRRAMARVLRGATESRLRKVRVFLRRAPSTESGYLAVKGLLLDEELEAVLDRHVREAAPDDILGQATCPDMPLAAPARQVSWLECRCYLQNQLLRDADAMSMAHGLEVRAPLLDHRLAEWVAGLPASLVFGGRPKSLLIDAVRPWVPAHVLDRRKQGFVFPLDEWMRGPWRDELAERFATGPLHGLLERAGVTALWARYLVRRALWSQVWAVYVLQAWCEAHLQPAAQAPEGSIALAAVGRGGG